MSTLAQDLFGPTGDMLASCLQPPPQSLPLSETRYDMTFHVPALGVLEVIPANPPLGALVISSGIHGNETAPIEILNKLVDALITGQLQAKRPLLLIMGHPAAMRVQQRFIEINMNRLFLGEHKKSGINQSEDARRAACLEKCVADFHSRHPVSEHYDLHTAIRTSHIERFALYPYREDSCPSALHMHTLAAMGVSALIHQHRPATTFSAHSARTCKADSFTVELGRVKPFGHNELSQFDDLYHTLSKRMHGETPGEGASRITHFDVAHEIIHQGDMFDLHVPEHADNFTPFAPGTTIWESADAAYRVADQEEYIVFPNTQVPKGQRAGLMLRRRPSA